MAKRTTGDVTLLRMGLMAFIRKRLGQNLAPEPSSQWPDDPDLPPDDALVPQGPPRHPRPTLAAELPLPEDEAKPPLDARGRELEQ